MKVASVAVLLEDECASDAGAKQGQPDVFQPDMSVRNKVGMREFGEELNLYQNLFKPSMIIANRHPLTSKMAQLAAVNFMPHQ
jgi:hypothetical protein